jgi:hypothetical protein
MPNFVCKMSAKLQRSNALVLVTIHPGPDQNIAGAAASSMIAANACSTQQQPQ